MFFEFFHVYLLVAAWTLIGSRRTVLIGSVIAMSTALVLSVSFGANPDHAYLARYGIAAYLRIWTIILLNDVVAPALAAFLLLRADRIAPRVFKDWRPVYG